MHNLNSLFFFGGNKAIEEHHAENPIPRKTFQNSVDAVRALDEKKADQLERLMERLAPVIEGPGRGRQAPKVGDERGFKTQQTKVGGPFLRIPTDTLGLAKGEVARVVFEDGEIRIRVEQETSETPAEQAA